MFTIKADGREIYNPALFDEQYQVINPELTLEVNKAGSLSFTMPPCNAMWGSLNKLTSVISVEQDGIEIFRGRVMNDETDTYKQRYVYCEGELAYLLDSIQRPYEFSGNAVDLFKQFITNHNESVNAEKQFTIGRITAVDTSTAAAIDASSHSDTFTEIEDRLLDAYGGYIRIRHENGTRYIDYLSESGDDNTQPIQFGVNLLDLKESISAEDIFTVLIPTGAMQNGDDGKFDALLNITSVNNGLDYIEDAEGIAKYGRIWKRKHWDYIEDAAELKEKGQEYLATGITEDATLTITAVDMHFVDPKKQRIAIGDMVQILSNPHGLDRVTICYKIVMPLQEPEKTVYTFGEPEKTLTDNVVTVNESTGGGGGGGRTTEEEVQDIIRWAYARADEDNARYEILTGELEQSTGRLSEAEIRLNGVEATIQLKADRDIVDAYGERISKAEVSLDGALAQINLKADQEIVTEYGTRLSRAEIAIDGANAAIAMKADQSQVTDQGERLTNAEVNINGLQADILLKASHEELNTLGERLSKAEASIQVNANGIEMKVSRNGIISAINQTAESVRISANKINLDGYVTMEDFEALQGTVENLWSEQLIVDSVSANHVSGGEADFDNLVFGTIAGKSSDAWVADIINNQSSIKVGGATVATQNWVSGRGYATQSWVNNQGFATTAALNTQINNVNNWVLENYATKSWVNAQNYLTKGALTTKEITVVSSVNATKATIASGFTYVSNVTYNTTKYTIVTFA